MTTKRSYDTEIISVGTELLLGHVTNTDARDVSEQLSKIGVNVRYHTVVGDNPERLAQCIETAKGRADIIITTGGLGPTCDDLTKVVTARAFGVPLVEDKSETAGLYEYIKNSRHFTPNNFSQAMLPEGCTVFHNTCGTAPGCAFEKDGKVVLMLPGPPKECYAMLTKSAIPYLRRLGDGEIVSHSVRIFGIGESAVDAIFADEMNAMTNPSMAPYAKECDCLVQVTAKAATQEEAERMVRPVMEHVKERLGEYVYGVDVESVEESVMQLLHSRPMTFAAAESCTGGEIAKRFTDLPGERVFPRRHGDVHERREGGASGHCPGADRGEGRGEPRGRTGDGGTRQSAPRRGHRSRRDRAGRSRRRRRARGRHGVRGDGRGGENLGAGAAHGRAPHAQLRPPHGWQPRL